MINAIGLIIVLMLVFGLRQQGFSFQPFEQKLQQIGIWGRAAIAVVLAVGTATGAHWGGGAFTYIFSPLHWPALLVSLIYIALYWIHEAGHGLVNLVIHELAVSNALAGTAFQMLVPLGLAFYLFLRRTYLAAGSFMIYVLGLSLLMTAPYIGDARAQALPLLIGEHDWAFLLKKWGLLELDTRFQAVFHTSGWIIVVAGLLAFVFVSGRPAPEKEGAVPTENRRVS